MVLEKGTRLLGIIYAFGEQENSIIALWLLDRKVLRNVQILGWVVFWMFLGRV